MGSEQKVFALKDRAGYFWAVPELVWHGLSGQNMKEEPIKPQKIM